MSMPSARTAIEQRMRLISNTLHADDLDESLADVHGYIDALREFGHISEDDSDRLSREARELRDVTAAKLLKKQNVRRY